MFASSHYLFCQPMRIFQPNAVTLTKISHQLSAITDTISEVMIAKMAEIASHRTIFTLSPRQTALRVGRVILFPSKIMVL
ncbi:hypothetical protein D5072_19760 [Dickeya dianthicola]|uniref:Uncharacterized protein n=1 Tax=Dickeya dianthicola TaxID=204039 RepID=A0AAX1CAP6_9GAMM|nr:hypothetical protein DF213_03765 [Dickeya dianthicola]RJL62985.1 hypothetical protein D5072_19760 [Dickeya dianthicola]RJL66505.1 hypothetical protein D5077_20460 [Dickeya dianthicola]